MKIAGATKLKLGTVLIALLFVVTSQSSWAGTKKHAFDYPPNEVYKAAHRVASEWYTVVFEDERDRVFSFTSGIGKTNWGYRIHVSVTDKSEMIMDFKKRFPSISELGAQGRLAALGLPYLPRARWDALPRL